MYKTLCQTDFSSLFSDLKQVVDTQGSTIEASKSRITELENILSKKDTIIQEQKELIERIKEQYHSQLQVRSHFHIFPVRMYVNLSIFRLN